MADQSNRLSADDAQDLIDAQQHLYAAGDPRAGKLYNYIVQNGYATRGPQGELRPMDTMSAAPAPWSWQGVKSAVLHPLNSLEAAAQTHTLPRDASTGEIVATDVGNVASGAAQFIRHPGQAVQGALTSGLGMRPVVESAENALLAAAGKPAAHPGAHIVPQSREEAAAALGQTALTAGVAKVVPPLASAAWEKTAPVLSQLADVPQESTVSGENFTPRQQKAHAAVIAEGNPAGDTHYIPQTIAKQSGSLLRDVAGQNPQLVDQIQRGSPVEAYQAQQTMLRQAKSVIDQIHERALAPVQNAPVDTASIQDAIRPTRFQLEGIDPSDLRSIQELQARAANVTELRGLNEFRQTLNAEDSVLRGNPMAQGKSALYPQTVHTMANAVRDAYYDALENVTGQDFTSVKRMEGSIIQQMRGAEGAAPRLTIAEAKDAAPQGLRQLGANLVESTGGGSVHLPVAGYVAQKLRGTALDQIQGQLKRFYSDLPATPSVQFPQPRPIAGMLPRGAVAMGAPETAYAPSAPPPVSATTRAQRLGLLLQAPPIELPGAVEQRFPPLDYTTTAQRLGRLLPEKSGAPTILPYNPEMTAGERSAALNQWLKMRRQQALPARAQPIRLPAPEAER